jgi:hypothetical protein
MKKKRAFVMFVLLISVKSLCFGWVTVNGSESAFTPPRNGLELSGSSSKTMRQLVAEAASHFFYANSHFQIFLGRVELLDEDENLSNLESILNDASYDMSKALENYKELVEMAKITPYNESVIQLLKNYDYDGFQEENKILPSVFQDVKEYLVQGDVIGVYQKIYDDTDSICKSIDDIKSNLDLQLCLTIDKIRNLSHMIMTSALFGHYIALVFAQLNQ